VLVRKTTMYSSSHTSNILALSGGIGGAKLALGLSRLLSPQQLTIVANTGDDFEHLGLYISPDLDTLMYTLAGLQNQQQGWGLANESWNTHNTLSKLGAENWFQLGDRDIATHLIRTAALNQGQSLSQITESLCNRLGVEVKILPMSDDPVRTKLETDIGILDFQHYFVRDRCQPKVKKLHFEGVAEAHAQDKFLDLLDGDSLDAIIICPSNPFLSVAPIIELNGVRDAMMGNSAPVIAVSPIIAGTVVKGPAAKMMAELDIPPSALEIARYYGSLLDVIVIDKADAKYEEAINELGIATLLAPIMMNTAEEKVQLADAILNLVFQLNTKPLNHAVNV